MSPTIRRTAALFALALPALFSASSALSADAQFMHPDAAVQ